MEHFNHYSTFSSLKTYGRNGAQSMNELEVCCEMLFSGHDLQLLASLVTCTWPVQGQAGSKFHHGQGSGY